MNNTFLAVNNDYLDSDLQPIDILILSKVAEFHRNQCDCYLTNERLARMFGTTLYSVKTSLDRLENQNYITRSIEFIGGRGRANKQRIIKLTASN
jgi:DNA-binding MarR family transcriptional regulator